MAFDGDVWFMGFAAIARSETSRELKTRPRSAPKALAVFFIRAPTSKDEHCITQKESQPSQTCSGGFINAQLYVIRCCLFAIGEYNQIELELIQTQMAQKPMLRAEVGMRVRCANKASAE